MERSICHGLKCLWIIAEDGPESREPFVELFSRRMPKRERDSMPDGSVVAFPLIVDDAYKPHGQADAGEIPYGRSRCAHDEIVLRG
jgi:hypothetical protein